ncbi:MAG: DUF1127 domain-containing protein [Mangrovicoccus sp.]|nr:DUF1127 domain-containing protein [Mangrovicoccus sp.]
MTASQRSSQAAHPAASLRFSIFRVLRDAIGRIRRRRRDAIAIGDLEALPDHLLADIGLSRDRDSGIIGDPHRVRWEGPPELR